ncbi:MAG: carboxypeptidase-like regulatory domain-containing protein [Planctomycetaceae bacterium]|jgi:hypothetical protein|nr:carboxypeptidase-like regulatory domain-containing protein [Planctomycetaceae bacterium]
MKFYPIFALLFVCVCAIGCGNNQRLSGKVTFSEDGSPLTVGVVCFENTKTGSLGRGTINTNGTYVVGFESDKNGIPKGTYKVFITNAMQEKGLDQKTGMPITEPLIDPKYSNANTSGVTFNADGKTKTLNITVEHPPAKK